MAAVESCSSARVRRRRDGYRRKTMQRTNGNAGNTQPVSMVRILKCSVKSDVLKYVLLAKMGENKHSHACAYRQALVAPTK